MSLVVNLIAGLYVTLLHMFKRAVTLQYPKQRCEVADRFRGLVRIIADKCTGCGLCANSCPAYAINIQTHRDEHGKRKIDVFEIDIGRCIFCGSCTQACPAGVLAMSKDYELATYSRNQLIYSQDTLRNGPEIIKYKK